jgi:hypothetical protein
VLPLVARAAAPLLTRDEARRIAANIAKAARTPSQPRLKAGITPSIETPIAKRRDLTAPWTAEETDACFIVRDHNGQART